MKKVSVQVITAELNRVVADLLQQLLYWQERNKALNPMKAKKRLVSGLREVSLLTRLSKRTFASLTSISHAEFHLQGIPLQLGLAH